MAIDVDARQLELIASGVRIIALRTLADPDAAADVVQETLARTLAAIQNGQIADPERLGPFVRGIAHHVIADVLRARAKMPTTDLSSAIEIPGADVDALSAIVTEENRRLLIEAFGQLDDADRRLLSLTFVKGMTSAELARHLGEPADRIRKRKSRALDRLREGLLAGEAGSRSAPARDYSMGHAPAGSRGRGS